MKLYTFSELDINAKKAVMNRFVDANNPADAADIITTLLYLRKWENDDVERYSMDGSYGWPAV